MVSLHVVPNTSSIYITRTTSLLFLYGPDKNGEEFTRKWKGIPDIITLFRVKLPKISSKEVAKFTLLARNTFNLISSLILYRY